VFPASLPYSENDLVGLAFHQPDVHVNMSYVLVQCPTRSSNRYEARFNRHLDAFWDIEFFGLEDVPHLRKNAVNDLYDSIRSRRTQSSRKVDGSCAENEAGGPPPG
jgi:hypothetical protein